MELLTSDWFALHRNHIVYCITSQYRNELKCLVYSLFCIALVIDFCFILIHHIAVDIEIELEADFIQVVEVVCLLTNQIFYNVFAVIYLECPFH